MKPSTQCQPDHDSYDTKGDTMRTNEEMLHEIETANNGEGPTPINSYYGTALNDIMAAVKERGNIDDRISQAVARARDEGATWAMIGQALSMTRQGALKRYREPMST